MPTRVIAEGLSELLPASRLMAVDGAGHMGPLTHAPEVSALIVRHIVDGRGRSAPRRWRPRSLADILACRIAAGGGGGVTYTIPRYPVHLIDVVRVADGSRVTIRPTLPQDVELQRAFFRSLSAEGRYCRFMTRLNELPEALIERFARIDYRSHLALLAEVFESGRETMIGEARYIVDERDPETCEFAIAVADDWQTSGIASALLDRLERQAAAIRHPPHGRRYADLQQGDDRARPARAAMPSAKQEDAMLARLEKSCRRCRHRRLPPDRGTPKQPTQHEKPRPNGERR